MVEIQDNTKEYDLIQVIGIFLDNAFEAVGNNAEEAQKLVDIKLKIDKSEISIIVENVGSYMTNEQIQKCFTKGFSTKGKERGLGLYNVKEIKEKYKAEVIVKNIELESENRVSFQFMLNHGI